MKNKLMGIALILFCGWGVANGETLLDHQTGLYHYYDIERYCGYGVMTDLQTGSRMETSASGERCVIFDHQSGSFYELRRTGPYTYVGFDYGTGTTHEFQIDDGGSISVTNPASGQTFHFTGKPM